ncbi:hypothetical protein N7478_006706 [Penicillium angulare]|uniref:uncharacterized protein n=1 Tax=Penicillium angulare TaxID=116970 RepID=UPI002541064E|nr:uncharacterized protein N7478_006706 [Penicillium angulare]KAJ5281334.1 hypothetical protein N7478_006706 [Penicillium angulare]
MDLSYRASKTFPKYDLERFWPANFESDSSLCKETLPFGPAPLIWVNAQASSPVWLIYGLTICGILDWKLAQFAPRWYGCAPPAWLWDEQWTASSDERFEPRQPIDEERRQAKQAFDKAVGPCFTKLAYQPQYRLARQVVHLVDMGIRRNPAELEALEMLEKGWKDWRTPYSPEWKLSKNQDSQR